MQTKCSLTNIILYDILPKINHIHEKALRIVYKHFNSSFRELIIEGNSLNIYYRNLQKLVTEIFQVKTGLSPELMNNLSDFIEKPYSLRKTSHFESVAGFKVKIKTWCQRTVLADYVNHIFTK